MGRVTLADEYFSWLYDQIARKPRSYIKLCKELHRKQFRWFVPNDDNRCADGVALRERFVEERGYDESHLEVSYFLRSDCTIFEVLVGISRHMNDLMFDLNNTRNDKTARFFHILLENLRLDVFTDNYRNTRDLDPVTEAEIHEILEVLMDRTYAADGRGGLFPLKKRHREDQSKVELWYQMMTWLEENYG